jgi:very-short-patch-repair endonuclease
MSLPEVILWEQLRLRPGGHKFRRQHPAGPYVLDFACISARLAIEIDGLAHERGANPHRDACRDEWLANQGFSTLRFSARDVLDNLDGVVTAIMSHCGPAQPLRRRSATPPPRIGEEL